MIRKYLESKNLKFWTFSENSLERLELYTIFNETESERKVSLHSYSIQLFVDHDGFTGSASAQFPKSLSFEEQKKIIDNAISEAKLVNNQFYEIKQPKQEYEFNDSYQGIDNIEKIKSIQENIKNITFSSSEYFINNYTKSFSNSAGNSYIKKSSDILFDTVMLSLNQEVESQFAQNIKSLNAINLEQIFEDNAKYAIDSLTASLPKAGKYRVAFTGEVLEEFFSFLIFHSLGSSLYNNCSMFKRDERIYPKADELLGSKFIYNRFVGNKFEDISIYSDPFLQYGLDSSVDDLGFKLSKFCIIEKAKLKSIVCNLKYSQYLSLPFTGGITNISISPGSESYRDLVEQEDTLLITRVSAFSPKEVTGDISAEIRSAYLFKGGKSIPIKGGSFSGNLKSLLPSLELSKEQIYYNSYFGPKCIVLSNVEVA